MYIVILSDLMVISVTPVFVYVRFLPTYRRMISVIDCTSGLLVASCEPN